MKSLEQKARQFVFIVKQRFEYETSKFEEFAKLLTSLQVEQNQDHAHLISKLEGLFAVDHPDLLSGLHEFLPKKYEASVVSNNDDDNDGDVIEHDQATKKKQCRREHEDVIEDDQAPKKKQCRREHEDVTEEEPDQARKKEQGRRKHEDIEEEPDQATKRKQCRRKHAWLLRKSSSEVFDKIRDRCVEKNDEEFIVLMEFCKIILLYHEKKITYSEADTRFKDLFRDDPDLFLEANCVLAESLGKPIKHTDWDGEKGSGGVVCSLYEETMDVKEFYLFETGLAFSRLESTIKALEKGPEGLEDLTALDFRCIKKLYDDSDDDHEGLGENMVQILKTDPVRGVVARVMVLERLRQKKRQMEEQKLHLDRIWNEIFEDIRERGRVQRHREFLRNTKQASTNGFVLK